MVRSDRAIRRHWQLVCCAFSFCWQAWFAEEATTANKLQPGWTDHTFDREPLQGRRRANCVASRSEHALCPRAAGLRPRSTRS